MCVNGGEVGCIYYCSLKKKLKIVLRIFVVNDLLFIWCLDVCCFFLK